MKDLLANIQPSHQEFVFILIAGTIASTLFVTFVDVMIHDGYVRPIIAECYDTNTVQFCEERRHELLEQSPIVKFMSETLLSKQDQQVLLGGHYWFTLLMITIFIALILGTGRIVLGFLAGAKINPMLFIIGGLWIFSVLLPFYFGYLDYGYYVLRGLDIPESLPWLNGVGLFQYVQQMGVDSDVNDTDLYTLMGVGLVLYVGVWALFTHHHKKKTFQRLGLI